MLWDVRRNSLLSTSCIMLRVYVRKYLRSHSSVSDGLGTGGMVTDKNRENKINLVNICMEINLHKMKMC